MEIGPIKRRAPMENSVPMINVVFLLLIFFLMSAQIAPPEPFEVEIPETESIEPADAEFILHVSPEGELAFEDQRGEAALSTIAGLADDAVIHIRADKGVDAAVIATLMKRLPEFGVSTARLISTVE